MSDPLSSGAGGVLMVSAWPVDQPAKTTHPNSPSAVALPEASPHKLSPQIQPSRQTLWQRKITELPPELLVMIFDHLEFDDIRQVNATCLAFRKVVKEINYIQELSYFAQLPRCFREQYQQHALGQKKSLHLHPFANHAPLNNRRVSFRERIIKNLPQMSALLCLDTLGRMESCPAYRMVELLKVTLPQRAAWNSQPQTGAVLEVCFSPSSRHLLFYGRCLNGSRILTRDDQGQWAEEPLNWPDSNVSRVITGARFSACTNHQLTRNAEGCVNTLRPGHRCWNVVSKLTLPPDQTVEFSPSGKYTVTYSRDNPVIIWRMGGNNNWLKMEVRGLSPGVLVDYIRFSPSEQYLVVRWSAPQERGGKMTLLSLDGPEA